MAPLLLGIRSYLFFSFGHQSGRSGYAMMLWYGDTAEHCHCWQMAQKSRWLHVAQVVFILSPRLLCLVYFV